MAAVVGGAAASALVVGAAPPGGVAWAVQADLARPTAADADLAVFYRARGYRPLWTGWSGMRPEASQLVDMLATSDQDGLRPQDYQPTRLRGLIAAAERRDEAALARAELALSRAYAAYAVDLRQPPVQGELVYTDRALAPPRTSAASVLEAAGEARSLHDHLAGLTTSNPIYAALRAGLADYRRRWGRLPQIDVPEQTLAPGARGAAVAALRIRLGLPGEGAYDGRTASAVRDFQAVHGLRPTGRADVATLRALNRGAGPYEALARANLARARALPVDLGPRFILVDAAAQRLWLYENGVATTTMKVVVGEPAHATPAMAGMMRYAVFNPYWNVPEDLVRDRIAPRYLREGQAYFEAEHLEALSDWSDDARVLDPRAIDWRAVASGERPLRVRQKPNARNMMGRVKLMLPNDLGIYLHDTPDRALFAERERAFSAGCVRLERAMELADELVGEGPAAHALAAGRETRVDLAAPVPVFIVYLTAAPEEGGRLAFRPDLYNRDAALLASLEARGPTSTQVATR
jgi:L,D-transpeptidase YcbB